MTLKSAREGREYVVQKVNVDDRELKAFLFTLGLYICEKICVIYNRHSGCTVKIKNARYSIDSRLAAAIIV